MTTSDRPPRPRHPLVVATRSPRRIALLSRLSIAFTCAPQAIDETPAPKEPAGVYVARMAQTKAARAAATATGGLRDGVFLGADTIVVYKEKLLGKPHNRQHAREMIRTLSGREHRVATAYHLTHHSQPPHTETVWTRVRFRPIAETELTAYLDHGDWHDKAGAYGIQSAAGFMVEAIFGSYTNVVGLPLAQVTVALRKMGCIDRLFAGTIAGKETPGDPSSCRANKPL
jgi:septum formation protein